MFRKAAIGVALGALALTMTEAALAFRANKKDECDRPKIYSFVNSRTSGSGASAIYHFVLIFWTAKQLVPDVGIVAWGSGGSSEGSGAITHNGWTKIEWDSQTDFYYDAKNPVEWVTVLGECNDSYTTASTKLYSQYQKHPSVPEIPGSHRSVASCPDYTIVDNRGSGRPEGELSPAGAAFAAAFRNLHAGLSVRVISNPYPAAGSWIDMLGAATKIGFLGKYHASVVAGKKWLASQLPKLKDNCRKTPIYLIGYSQGAQVAADVYQSGGAKYVSGMVLFGDPYFDGQDAVVDRVHLYQPPRGQFHPINGRLGDRPFFSGPGMRFVMSFCHQFDPVCQGLPAYYAKYRLKYHKDYALLGEPQQAANYFFNHS